MVRKGAGIRQLKLHTQPMTQSRLNILIIGHGAIASSVAQSLQDDPRFYLTSALCRPGRSAEAKHVLGASIKTIEAASAVDPSTQVAVDCAGHTALREHGATLLERGIDVLTVSNGALSDPQLLESLQDAAERGGSKLRLLSGAIGALDAIAAAQVGGLDYVRYTGRKPPGGWVGSPAENKIDLSAITDPTVHFQGSAGDAARLYPKNANVAATVALAGMGFDDTEACLIADPTITTNQHQVEASGAFGKLSFTIEGKGLPDNPRSSALTAMSVVKALHDIVDPLVS